MPSTTKTMALVAALASTIRAQSTIVDCDRLLAPNWDDCEDLMNNQLHWVDASTEQMNYCPDEEKNCRLWNRGTCKIGMCFFADKCVSNSLTELGDYYRLIHQDCGSQDLGGYSYPNNGRLEATYIEDKKRAVSAKFRRDPSPVTYEELTFDEYERRMGRGNNTAQKRDTTWTNLGSFLDVKKDGEGWPASNEIDSGVTQTFETTKENSVSVSLTAGVEAGFFDIFSVSMSISTTYEESFSVSEGLQYTSGDCPNKAVVWYYPTFDKYQGHFSDNPDKLVTIWVARSKGDKVDGKFETQCIGTS